MSSPTTDHEERILIVDEANGDREQAQAVLSAFFPAAKVQSAGSLESYRETIEKDEFDIIIIDSDLSKSASFVELIYQLKTENSEPSIVVVSRNSDAREVANLYKYGCHRCILKDDRWLEELGTAVDYLIRWRKARMENLRLRAKLTEANMLLQEKNKRLDEFSASVAHDIRGPLAGVAMRLEYVMENYDDQLKGRFGDLIRRAFDSTSRLTDLVQAMYDYAKLGKEAAKMDQVDLNQLVDEVVHPLNFDDSLDIQIRLGELPTVWASANLLRSVFINLINNAVKYNDKKQIVIAIDAGKISHKVLASFCELTVSDNGAGIPEEDLKDVFSMFVRGSQAGEYSSGEGIGLAVVRRIVELHYGELSVQSKVGEGTTFTLLLPMEKVGLTE